MTKRKNETREEYNLRMREYNRIYSRNRYHAQMEVLNQYKLEKGCTDCGYNKHFAGLEFDHIVERKGDRSLLISRILNTKGVEAALQHIEEFCEVVCGTCHGIRTYERSVGEKSVIVPPPRPASMRGLAQDTAPSKL